MREHARLRWCDMRTEVQAHVEHVHGLLARHAHMLGLALGNDPGLPGGTKLRARLREKVSTPVPLLRLHSQATTQSTQHQTCTHSARRTESPVSASSGGSSMRGSSGGAGGRVLMRNTCSGSVAQCRPSDSGCSARDLQGFTPSAAYAQTHAPPSRIPKPPPRDPASQRTLTARSSADSWRPATSLAHGDFAAAFVMAAFALNSARQSAEYGSVARNAGRHSASAADGHAQNREAPQPRSRSFAVDRDVPQHRARSFATTADAPQPRARSFLQGSNVQQARKRSFATTADAPQPRPRGFAQHSEEPQGHVRSFSESSQSAKLPAPPSTIMGSCNAGSSIATGSRLLPGNEAAPSLPPAQPASSRQAQRAGAALAPAPATAQPTIDSLMAQSGAQRAAPRPRSFQRLLAPHSDSSTPLGTGMALGQPRSRTLAPISTKTAEMHLPGLKPLVPARFHPTVRAAASSAAGSTALAHATQIESGWDADRETTTSHLLSTDGAGLLTTQQGDAVCRWDIDQALSPPWRSCAATGEAPSGVDSGAAMFDSSKRVGHPYDGAQAALEDASGGIYRPPSAPRHVFIPHDASLTDSLAQFVQRQAPPPQAPGTASPVAAIGGTDDSEGEPVWAYCNAAWDQPRTEDLRAGGCGGPLSAAGEGAYIPAHFGPEGPTSLVPPARASVGAPALPLAAAYGAREQWTAYAQPLRPAVEAPGQHLSSLQQLLHEQGLHGAPQRHSFAAPRPHYGSAYPRPADSGLDSLLHHSDQDHSNWPLLYGRGSSVDAAAVMFGRIPGSAHYECRACKSKRGQASAPKRAMRALAVAALSRLTCRSNEAKHAAPTAA